MYFEKLYVSVVEKIEIKPSIEHNAGLAVLSGVLILYYFLGPYSYTRVIYKTSPAFTIIVGIIFIGIFIHGFIRAVFRPTEIILDPTGMEIRHKGWNHWDYISSASIIIETNNENINKIETLLIKLKDNTTIKCITSDLEKNATEIIGLIRNFKPDIIYTGTQFD